MMRLLRSLIVLAAIAVAAGAGAAEYYKTAEGLAVYLGVLPAELVLGHSPEHPESRMHEGKSTGRGQHHIVVAVFDAKTGQRVTNAEVTARVEEPGLGLGTKKLEPMLIENTVSYGAYFPMQAPGPYRIDVDVRRAGAVRPVTVRFEYSHPRR